jgi:hypothetical protein
MSDEIRDEVPAEDAEDAEGHRRQFQVEEADEDAEGHRVPRAMP